MYERFKRDYDHSGLYVSERTPDEQADFHRLQQEIDTTYATLPLDGCTTAFDVLSERYCLAPPAGKVFRMTGKFYTELDGRYIEDYYSPNVDSHELARERAEKHPLYDVLAAVDNDPEKIVGFIERGNSWGEPYELDLQDGQYEELKREFAAYEPKHLPPRDFLGKQLIVQTESSNIGERRVKVAVFGQPKMWSDAGMMPIALPVAESDEDEVYYADVRTHMHWSREFAVGAVGYMTIELCDEPEEFRRFTRTKDRSRVDWDELWTPLGFNTTSQAYIDFVYQGFKESQRRLESARIYEMRRHRVMGLPFADDSARHFKIANPMMEDYYTRQKTLRQIVAPRSAFHYYDGVVREKLDATLGRYIGRMVTPEQYRASLKAFDEKGRFKDGSNDDYLSLDEKKDRLAKVKKRLYTAGGTFFYLEAQ